MSQTSWRGSLDIVGGRMRIAALALSAVACASGPPAPEWQSSAHGALERAIVAYLTGNSRDAEREFDLARAEVARTARVDLAARVELVRCAAQLASLVVEPCIGFERLRADAADAERVYADYLAGRRIEVERVQRLPAQHRAVAMASPGAAGDLAALRAITDPTARLLAAAIWLRAGRATPEVIDLSIDTASNQGWRRPLLAWLRVKRELAERALDRDEVQRLDRRIGLVLDAPGRRVSP